MKAIKLIFLLLVLAGCSQERLANDSVGFDDYQLYDRYVDDNGNEGIVAFKYNQDNYGIVLVLSADETLAAWGPENKNVIQFNDYANIDFADSYAFAIEINQTVELLGFEKFPAFGWCHNKNKDSKRIHASSWILPNVSFLSYIFSNLEKLNESLAKNGMTLLSDEAYYWTCNEDIEDYFHFADESAQNAYDYDPVSRAIPMATDLLFPTHKTAWQKEKVYRVRAVKCIYYKSLISEDDD